MGLRNILKRKRAFDRCFSLPYDALADENIVSWKLEVERMASRSPTVSNTLYLEG